MKTKEIMTVGQLKRAAEKHIRGHYTLTYWDANGRAQQFNSTYIEQSGTEFHLVGHVSHPFPIPNSSDSSEWIDKFNNEEFQFTVEFIVEDILDEEDIQFAEDSLDLFSDVVKDDVYNYVQILKKYHNTLVAAGLINSRPIN